jgi:predicted nuclease with TOPRIM domain
MKTIRFKIDDELFNKVNALRGNTGKTEFYGRILIEYLSKKPEEDRTSKQVSDLVNEFEALRAELAYKDAQIKAMKDERIKDMQNQLNFLQSEFQKLSSQLLKPPPAKWWHFWK